MPAEKYGELLKAVVRMPDKHAFLSPSSSERWFNCTPSAPRLVPNTVRQEMARIDRRRASPVLQVVPAHPTHVHPIAVP